MDGQNTKPALDRVPTVPLTAGWRSVKKHSGAGEKRVVVIPRLWGLKSLPGLDIVMPFQVQPVSGLVNRKIFILFHGSFSPAQQHLLAKTTHILR
jgi:hypothetical protein